MNFLIKYLRYGEFLSPTFLMDLNPNNELFNGIDILIIVLLIMTIIISMIWIIFDNDFMITRIKKLSISFLAIIVGYIYFRTATAIPAIIYTHIKTKSWIWVSIILIMITAFLIAIIIPGKKYKKYLGPVYKILFVDNFIHDNGYELRHYKGAILMDMENFVLDRNVVEFNQSDEHICQDAYIRIKSIKLIWPKRFVIDDYDILTDEEMREKRLKI